MPEKHTTPHRALLVGLGGIAESHLRAVQATDGRVRLAGICDVDPARARAFAEKHGIPAHHTDYYAAVEKTRPDIVIIAAPPAHHACMSIAAMNAGAWVFCEKPLCASLAEFDLLAETEARTGCHTASVVQFRYASSTNAIKRLADGGALGRPLLAICHTLWHRDAAYYAAPWRGKWAGEFGGATVTQGVHTLDQLLHHFGPWTEVSAQTGTLDRDIEVDDFSMAHIRFKNGARASVVNSVLSTRQETYLRLDYQRATVELTHLYTFDRSHWRITPAPGLHEADSVALSSALQQPGPDHAAIQTTQFLQFVEDLDARRRPLSSGPEMRRTIEILSAIYKSSATRAPVAAGSILPGDAYYDSISGCVK